MKNIIDQNDIFEFENKKYKKVPEEKPNSCFGCVTVQATELCDVAGDCDDVIVHVWRDWVQQFKNL